MSTNVPSDGVKMFEDVKIVTRSGQSITFNSSLCLVVHLKHRRVVEHARHWLVPQDSTVLRRLDAKQVEHGVVRCGYRSP